MKFLPKRLPGVLAALLILVIGLVGGILAIRATDSGPPAAKAGGLHNFEGTFTVYSRTGCQLHDTRFSDVSVGVPVFVEDATHTIVGSATLNAGKPTAGGCMFPWSMVSAIDTGDSDFYTVTVGRSTAVTYAADELAADSYEIHTSIGP